MKEGKKKSRCEKESEIKRKMDGCMDEGVLTVYEGWEGIARKVGRRNGLGIRMDECFVISTQCVCIQT